MPWLWLFTAVLILTPAPSWGHPGRTAADGCHFCRTNCAKWGQVAGARHCHGGVARPPRPAPPPPFQPRRGVERPSAVLHTTGYARIIDGDTVHIGAEKIRLQAIDAPEAQQLCQRANGARYACGHEATAALTQLIGGRAITCRFEPNRDLYQRLLGTCFLGELDVNGWLVANGHAVAYLHKLSGSQTKQLRKFKQNLIQALRDKLRGEKIFGLGYKKDTISARISADPLRLRDTQLLLSRLKLMRERFQTLLSSSAPVVGVVLSLSVIMNGCGPLTCCMSLPIQGNHGSVHYLVIGLGLLSVPKPEDETAVLATKVQTLGVSVSDQAGLKIGIGYASSTAVAVPDGAEDVRVEVSQKLGGPLTVETPKAKLAESRESKKERK